MKIKFFCMLLCVICFSVQTASAQKITFLKGYYKTTTGDSLRGYFDLDYLNNNRVRFSTTDVPRDMSTLDITQVAKIVCENGLTILTQPITSQGKDERIYISTIVTGKINLYRGFANNADEIFFISSDAIPSLKRINKGDPKAFLSVYFNKCDEIKRMDIQYNLSSLRAAINNIADCYKPFKRNMAETDTRYKSAKVSVGINVFGFNDKPKVTGFMKMNAKSFTPIGLGLAVRFKMTNSLSFGTGVNMWTNHIVAADSVTKRGFMRFYKALPTLSYQVFEIPIAINYLFRKVNGSFIPVITAGASFIKTKKIELSGDFEYNPTDPFDSFNTKYFEKLPTFDYGVFVGVSILKTFKSSAFMEFGIKYEHDTQTFTHFIGFENQKKTSISNDKVGFYIAYFYGFNKKTKTKKILN